MKARVALLRMGVKNLRGAFMGGCPFNRVFDLQGQYDA